jgi:hypothetical protein
METAGSALIFLDKIFAKRKFKIVTARKPCGDKVE